MSVTRREFGKLTVAACPAAGLLLRSTRVMAAAKPDSKWAGVQPVELFMRSPQAIAAAARGRSTARVEMTPEQAQKAGADDLRQWRLSAPMR